MDYWVDWLSLFFRWFHVIAGIAWIGASFYFVWLDNHLQTPPEWKQEKGIKGDLWAIHGGGFYEVAKYHLGPEKMPETLHWFKWEAYTTWLTGISLLIIVYYFNAQAFLLAPNAWLDSPALAIFAGLAMIALAVMVYEGLLRTKLANHGLAFALVILVMFTILSWLAFQWFSPRAAYIHIGAAIGSIMVGNVFWGIMPSQKQFVAAVIANEAPNEAAVMQARLRSLHNNYFTLPVIFIMISNHYPFVYAHEFGWLRLMCIGAITAYARHYFNLKNRGIHKPHILLVAAILAISLAVAMQPNAPVLNTTGQVTDTQVMQVVTKHCLSCHAASPSQAGFNAPPAGIVLATPAQLRAHGDRILKVAVYADVMPMGNMTGMTADERQLLGTWLLNSKTE